MTRYIIGCSNVSRFWNPSPELHGEYTITKATNYVTLDKELSEFKNNGSPIIIALLENIIEDAIHQATSLPEAREMGKKGIDKLINLIKTKENNYPESTVAIVCPIGRPGTEWYDLNIKGWTDDLIIATAEAKMKNLAIMGITNKETHQFEKDGVHLTKEAGAEYLLQITTQGRQMPIIKPSQKQPAAMEVDITNTPTKKPWQGRDSLEERVRKLEEHTRKLEDQVRRNSKNLTSSNIAISKIREELDAESNEKKNGRANHNRNKTN